MNKLKIFLSFIIPLLITCLVFYCKGFFTTNTYLVGDLQAQYVSLFSYLNELSNYSFSKGLGGGLIGTFSYYLASPLNILILFVSKTHIQDAMLLITIIKISLCGLTMYLYLRHKFPKLGSIILVFSTIYALIGYTTNFYFNIMWLDGVYFAPLILYGIDRIIANKSSLLYGISLALAIISNYYIGYMLCIFSVIYFGLELVKNFHLKDKYGHIIVKFIITSLIAGCTAGVLIIPTLVELQSSTKAFSHVIPRDFSINFNIFDILSKTYIGSHMYANIVNRQTFHIYTSIFILPLVYFYFINKKIPLKNRISSLVVLLIFIASFMSPFLNMVWHGFKFPIGLNGRYSFLFSLFLILIGIESFTKLKNISKKQYMIFLTGYLIITYVVLLFNYSYVQKVGLYISVFCMVLYLLILYNFKVNKEKENILKLILILLVFSELLFNFYICIRNYRHISKQEYTDTIEIVGKYIDKYNDHTSRIEKNFNLTKLDSLLYGYNGVTFFLSGSNTKQVNYLSNNGFTSSDNVIFYLNGNTPLLDAILNIKYLMLKGSSHNYYKKIDEFYFSCCQFDSYNILKVPVNIYENPYHLGLGFMVDKRILNFTDEFIKSKDYTNFSFQNYTLNTMLDNDIDYFKSLKRTYVDDQTYLFDVNDKDLYATVPIFNITDKLYIYIDDKLVNIYDPHSFGIFSLKNNYKNKQVKLTIRGSDEYNLAAYPEIFSFDKVNFEKSIKQLQKNSLNVTYNKNGHIKGNITVDKRNILFTSIPYEKGWEVYVDGKKTDYVSLLDAFIGVKLTKGYHNLEFKYKTPYFSLGLIVSIISIISFIIYMIFEKHIIKWIMKFYRKYEEVINYLIFGFLTTVVSIGSYVLFARLFNINYIISSILSWVFAVTFAFVTNKIFVFKSINKKWLKEVYRFFKYRIISLLIDVGLMIVLVDLIKIDDVIAKVVVQFLIVVINYLFSKLFVFKN